MDILELKVEERLTTGKETAKKLRAAGRVPAVLYGQGSNPLSLTVDAKEFYSLTHSGAGAHAIVKLNLDGEKKAPIVIVKAIQRNPVKNSVVHVDFQRIALNEKIHTTVPINIIGVSIGVREGGILQHGFWEVMVEALPTDIPEHIDADVTDIHAGEFLRVKDLPVINGITYISAGDDIIASVVAATVKEEEPAAEEEEVVSPEVIGEKASAEAEGER